MKYLTKTIYNVLLIGALMSFISCKKIIRSFGDAAYEKVSTSIGKSTSKDLSEKALRKMNWEDIIDYVKKENIPLAESLEKLDRKTRKSILQAIQDDARFFNSLRTPQYNLINDFKLFTSEVPKLANDVSFLKMFANSKYEAKRFGAVDLFDQVVLKEQNGFVNFVRKENQQVIAKYRDGIIELTNDLSKGSRISETSLLRYQLFPNSTYKFRGKDGLLYLFNIDNYGRVSSVKANYISANDITTNILNRNFDIYLGHDWEVSLKQLRQASRGKDIELDIVYKYVDNSSTPKYAKVDAKIRGKRQFKKTFENIGDIIPSGNGGINGEGRTLKEICEKPVPEHLIRKLDGVGVASDIVSRIKADLARMGSSRVPQPAQNGHVDFREIAWPGVSARLPEKAELIAAIRNSYPNIAFDDISARSIRDVTYYIGRKALADKYGLTIKQAANIIGLLDLVIHETDDARIEIVPNNVHRFKQLYAHKGYVSKMLKEINGKEIADEDE